MRRLIQGKGNVLLCTAMLLTGGAAVSTGYGVVQKISQNRAIEKRTKQLVKRFNNAKICPPDHYNVSGECYSNGERIRIRAKADGLRREGKFCEAGMEYAKLSAKSDMENEAREMADECRKQGNKVGQKKIQVELGARENAAYVMSRSGKKR